MSNTKLPRRKVLGASAHQRSADFGKSLCDFRGLDQLAKLARDLRRRKNPAQRLHPVLAKFVDNERVLAP